MVRVLRYQDFSSVEAKTTKGKGASLNGKLYMLGDIKHTDKWFTVALNMLTYTLYWITACCIYAGLLQGNIT